MAAALAAREEAGEAEAPDQDAMSDVSSVVSGLSAYTQRSAAPGGTTTAASSTFAPSTVGGHRPMRHRRGKVCPQAWLLWTA